MTNMENNKLVFEHMHVNLEMLANGLGYDLDVVSFDQFVKFQFVLLQQLE